MRKIAQLIFLSSGVVMGALGAKVVDIHLSGPSEWNLHNDSEENKAVNKAINTINDPTSSEENKNKAYEILENTDKLCISSP